MRAWFAYVLFGVAFTVGPVHVWAEINNHDLTALVTFAVLDVVVFAAGYYIAWNRYVYQASLEEGC